MPLDPATKLKLNITELCRRCIRGKAAAKNWYVPCHSGLRIVSIILSSLGSVGVIVEKVDPNFFGTSGKSFWVSMILLIVGILSQLFSEFKLGERATDSRSLAGKCEVYYTRLESILVDVDPTTDTASMLVELKDLFLNERNNSVLPIMTPSMETEAKDSATSLIARNGQYWDLAVRTQKGLATAAAPEPARVASTPEATTVSSGESSHAR